MIKNQASHTCSTADLSAPNLLNLTDALIIGRYGDQRSSAVSTILSTTTQLPFVCMRWLGNEGLSALIGLALVLGLIYLLSYGWIRGVLALGSAAFVAVAFGRHEDYGLRILMLLAVGLAIMISISIYYSWGGGSTSWWVRAYTFCLIVTSLWAWIQRNAPWKIWVIPIAATVLIAWVYVVTSAPGAGMAEEFVEVEAIPVDKLLERDATLLQGMYDATNGRSGIHVYPQQLRQWVKLAPEHMQIAAERLVHNGSIEWDDEAGGFVLERKGIEFVERLHRNKKRAPPMSNAFHFHGSASGVFGSHNKVRGNTFRSSGAPAEWVQAALAAAIDLHGRVTPGIADEIEQAHDELREAGADESRLRRAAGRMAKIAEAVGEVGAPLLRAANEILKALPG